ncbi:MAG TPA: hypothetical protein VFD43_09165 [Planctomycetota bacterium]|nr:hypothetical protein [Planctomycetota bacterium]
MNAVSDGPGQGRRALLAAGACAALGLALLVRPELLARRFPQTGAFPAEAFVAATTAVATSVGAAALVLALALAAWALKSPATRAAGVWFGSALGGGLYLCLTAVLSGWLVDDAAITFSYSENLVAGHGLVLFPGHAPEEAYSTTLWMLILAALRSVGGDIPLAAKALDLGLGVLTVWLTLDVASRVVGRALSPAGLALCLVLLLTAPFLIWTVSGLEHALEGVCFLLMLRAIAAQRAAVRTCAWSGAALVLLRPEAPLVLAGLLLVLALDRWRETRRWAGVLALWPLVAVPAATLAGLTAFRIAYFGDPLPNPYYAKAATATALSLLNPVGGSWSYVLSWLRSGAIACVLPLWAFFAWRRMPLAVAAALALLAGHLGFVLYVRGDWMSHWRFLCVLTPLLAVITTWGFELLPDGSRGLGRRLAWIVGLLVVPSTLNHLVEFRAAPTTPFAVVAHIGARFREAARRLGLEHPRLAHHDAGGTSFRSVIDVVDLGGLGDRAIAQHMDDREFLEHYLFDVKRPDFIFGVASTFAAGRSGFHLSPRFRQEYVPITWPDDPLMAADLSVVRRDRVREAEGLELIRVDGELGGVRVR